MSSVCDAEIIQCYLLVKIKLSNWALKRLLIHATLVYKIRNSWHLQFSITNALSCQCSAAYVATVLTVYLYDYNSRASHIIKQGQFRGLQRHSRALLSSRRIWESEIVEINPQQTFRHSKCCISLQSGCLSLIRTSLRLKLPPRLLETSTSPSS